jgi:hypothetical protein
VRGGGERGEIKRHAECAGAGCAETLNCRKQAGASGALRAVPAGARSTPLACASHPSRYLRVGGIRPGSAAQASPA